MTTKRVRATNAEITAETTSKILRCTIDCLAQLGYAGTTLAQISSRAGVSGAALLYHFTSKDALMLAVIERIFSDLQAYYHRDVDTSAPIRDRVLAILKKSYVWTQSADYAALIELSLAASRSPTLSTLVSSAMRSHDNAFDVEWESLLASVGIPPERSGLIRDFGVSTLRGLAVSRQLQRENSSIDRQMAMLTRIVMAEIAPPETGHT